MNTKRRTPVNLWEKREASKCVPKDILRTCEDAGFEQCTCITLFQKDSHFACKKPQWPIRRTLKSLVSESRI